MFSLCLVLDHLPDPVVFDVADQDYDAGRSSEHDLPRLSVRNSLVNLLLALNLFSKIFDGQVAQSSNRDHALREQDDSNKPLLKLY